LARSLKNPLNKRGKSIRTLSANQECLQILHAFLTLLSRDESIVPAWIGGVRVQQMLLAIARTARSRAWPLTCCCCAIGSDP